MLLYIHTQSSISDAGDGPRKMNVHVCAISFYIVKEYYDKCSGTWTSNTHMEYTLLEATVIIKIYKTNFVL